MSTTAQPAAIAWDELHSKDRDKANAFYQTLFGWTATAVPMGPDYIYHLLSHPGSEESFAGSHQQGEEEKDVPSYWLVSLGTNDVDAATARAQELGSTVIMPPADIPNIGRFSLFLDPQGAVVGTLAYSDGNSAPARLEGPGKIIWHELVSDKPDVSGKFYADVFGFDVEPADIGGLKATLFKQNGEMFADILPKPVPEAPDAWIFYVEVADLDKTIEQATALGGTVIHPPVEIPPIGTHCWLADPTGAVFGVLQPSEPAVS